MRFSRRLFRIHGETPQYRNMELCTCERNTHAENYEKITTLKSRRTIKVKIRKFQWDV